MEAFEFGVRISDPPSPSFGATSRCDERKSGSDNPVCARGIELKRKGRRLGRNGGGFWHVQAAFYLRLNRPKQSKTNQNKAKKILSVANRWGRPSAECGHSGKFWKFRDVHIGGVEDRRFGLRRVTVSNGQLRWITPLFYFFGGTE